MKAFYLSLCLIVASAAFGDSIYTDGQGEMLEKVFHTISCVLYGDAKTGVDRIFNSLVRIAITFGAFGALLLAFYRQRFDPLIRNFLVPSLIVACFLLTPTTMVTIVDHAPSLKKREEIRIPFFLGKFAAWTSYCFDRLHNLFLHSIDKPYPWLANLYADRNFLRPKSIVLSHPDLQENFQTFCQECVTRDLDIGLYTKKELDEQLDLIAFLENKTSSKRAMGYLTQNQRELFSCQEAIKKMRPLLENETKAAYDHFSEPAMPGAANEKQQQNCLLKQKIIIDFLQDALCSRIDAYETREKIAFLATVSLMSLRSFIEAVLYLAFPLIMLISLFSLGLRPIIHWIRALLWVFIWPIFYIAIDLFLDSLWKFYQGEHLELTRATLPALAKYYSTLQIIASILLAAVPFLSAFLIKSGFSRFVHVFSVSAPEASNQQRETNLAAAPPISESHDALRQTHQGVVPEEKQVFSEGAFKAVVEDAIASERHQSLQGSLSAIKEAIKDSSEEVSRAIQEMSNNTEKKPILHIPQQSGNHEQQIQEDSSNSSRMHIPALGSWATLAKPQTGRCDE